MAAAAASSFDDSESTIIDVLSSLRSLRQGAATTTTTAAAAVQPQQTQAHGDAAAAPETLLPPMADTVIEEASAAAASAAGSCFQSPVKASKSSSSSSDLRFDGNALSDSAAALSSPHGCSAVTLLGLARSPPKPKASRRRSTEKDEEEGGDAGAVGGAAVEDVGNSATFTDLLAMSCLTTPPPPKPLCPLSAGTKSSKGVGHSGKNAATVKALCALYGEADEDKGRFENGVLAASSTSSGEAAAGLIRSPLTSSTSFECSPDGVAEGFAQKSLHAALSTGISAEGQAVSEASSSKASVAKTKTRRRGDCDMDVNEEDADCCDDDDDDCGEGGDRLGFEIAEPSSTHFSTPCVVDALSGEVSKRRRLSLLADAVLLADAAMMGGALDDAVAAPAAPES